MHNKKKNSYFSTKTYALGTQKIVSMIQFFWAHKTHVKNDGQENIYNFMLKKIVYLNLCLFFSANICVIMLTHEPVKDDLLIFFLAIGVALIGVASTRSEALKIVYAFLAHLSRRLRGELLVYQWLRRPSSVVRRPSVNIFKHLLLWNHWANWTQISYGDSLGWGNKRLFKCSWSHDQDGRHAHIW